MNRANRTVIVKRGALKCDCCYRLSKLNINAIIYLLNWFLRWVHYYYDEQQLLFLFFIVVSFFALYTHYRPCSFVLGFHLTKEQQRWRCELFIKIRNANDAKPKRSFFFCCVQFVWLSWELCHWPNAALSVKSNWCGLESLVLDQKCVFKTNQIYDSKYISIFVVPCHAMPCRAKVYHSVGLSPKHALMRSKRLLCVIRCRTM